MTVRNVLGQHVATLVDTNQAAGQYQVNWNISSLSKGVYFYTLEADNFQQTKMMVFE